MRYLFCNKRVKVFLEVQMPEDQPAPLLAIENVYAAACHLFYT